MFGRNSLLMSHSPLQSCFPRIDRKIIANPSSQKCAKIVLWLQKLFHDDDDDDAFILENNVFPWEISPGNERNRWLTFPTRFIRSLPSLKMQPVSHHFLSTAARQHSSENASRGLMATMTIYLFSQVAKWSPSVKIIWKNLRQLQAAPEHS